MVKEGFIVRLANGIFVQDATVLPSVAEIALAKAKAYGMHLVQHAENLLSELGIFSKGADEMLFAKRGGSSSFLTVHGRVYLKGVCERKLALAETHIGQVLYALWHLGSKDCSEKDLRVAKAEFKRTERRDLWLAGSVIPAWLNKICSAWHPTPQIAIRDYSGQYPKSNLMRSKLVNTFIASEMTKVRLRA